MFLSLRVVKTAVKRTHSPPFQKIIYQNLLMKIERKYMYIGLSLVALILINQLVIQYFLFQKLEDAKELNLTGRQRMLSQRVNLMAYRVYENPDTFQRKQLLLVLNDWEKAHLTLLNGNKTSGFSAIKGEEIHQKDFDGGLCCQC